MSTYRKLNILFVLCFTLLAMVPRMRGQAVSGRLEGVVQDQSKSVIPSVSVVAVSQGTGLTYQAVTNQAGRYVLPNLPPGTYTLSATWPGFKKTMLEGIILQIGDDITQDLTLSPGAVTESVTVSAEANSVNLTTATLGSVVQTRQAVDLPLNGRDPMSLYYLAAGTNPIDRTASNQQQIGIVDGLQSNTNSVKVEGVNAGNTGYDMSPAHPSTPVPQEALAEYRVSTSTDEADAGLGSGAQVKVLIKSGTNQLHGSLFEFNRNTDFNGNDWFNNKNGLARPVLQRNQFGGSLGGPIRRNKTFFFVTAEWQRQISDAVENSIVYTPALRTGTFRYLVGGTNSSSAVNGQGIPIVSNQIGQINLATVDPSRLGIDTMYFPKLLNVMPLPNNYSLGDGLNTAGYAYNSSNPDNYYQVLFKIDHEINSKNHLAFSASQDIENAPQPKLADGISPEGFTERRRGFSMRLVSILTPHMTNELSFGANDRTTQRPIVNTVNLPGILGPGQQTPAGNIQFAGLGTVSGGAPNVNGNYDTVRSPQVNPQVNRGGQDEATWIKGNHIVHFGGEFWLESMNRTVGTQQYPVLSTTNSGNPANVPALAGLSSQDRSIAAQLTNDVTGTIGSITQNFYLASPTGGYVPYQQRYEPLRKTESAWFVQDSWKVIPRLSINGGLHWDYLPPVTMADGVYAYPINGVAGALGVQGPTGQPTQWAFAQANGGSIFSTRKANFSPSVGLAWDPFGDQRTAIRAGYRMAYDRFSIVNGDFSADQYGASTTVTVNPPNTRFSSPNLYSGVLPLPTPTLFAPLGNVRQGNAYVADPNLGIPYVHLWNFTIEREVTHGWKVGASYVGNHAVGMWRGSNLNQVNITSNGFLNAFKIAQANLAASGSPTTGQSLGNLTSLFKLLPSSQYNSVSQGQVAAIANYLDTNTSATGVPGGFLTMAGLPATFFRYNPQVSSLYLIGNRGGSTYDALQLTAMKQLQKGFYFQMNYTFSKALTDQLLGQDFTNNYRDVNNPHLDKSLSSFDATHVFLANGIWEVPVGHGRRFLSGAPTWVNTVMGGWQLNGILSFTTGRPIHITTNRSNLSQFTTSNPDFNGSFKNLGTVYENGNNVTYATPQEAAAFTNPGAGSAGSLANYAIHGPGFSSFDLSLFKKFSFSRERAQLQVRGEVFNVLNHPSFQNPGSDNIDSGSFGVLTSDYSPRICQLALKLTF